MPWPKKPHCLQLFVMAQYASKLCFSRRTFSAFKTISLLFNWKLSLTHQMNISYVQSSVKYGLWPSMHSVYLAQNYIDKFRGFFYLLIPVGTNCAPLVADLFLFCFERDFMLSLSEDTNLMFLKRSTSRYLDDLLNIDNNFFDGMVNRIYPSEFQLIRPTYQIPITHFWIYIYLYRMVVSRLKFLLIMINEIILILIL